MEGWEEYKIKEILSIGNGRDYKHLQYGNIPVLGTGGYITSVNDYLFDGETVCIGRKGTIDSPIYHNGKLWTVDTLFYTHSFKNVFPVFLFYLFQTINWKKYNEASGVPSLSKNTIENINIQIPISLKEQEKIAKILSTIDSNIEQTKHLITKHKQIKQGLLHDLLTYGIDSDGSIRNPQTHRFIEKNGLIIPEEWEVDYLKNCCTTFRSGNNITSKAIFPIAQFPVYGGNGLRGYTNTYTHSGKYILIGRQGALCGNINIVTGKNYISEHAIAVQFNEKNNINYWYYKLIFSNLNQYSSQSAQPGLAVEKLLQLTFSIPNLKEQEKISKLLSSQDSLIESEEIHLAKLQKLKQGLMQDLLSGKVRVKS